MYTGQKAPTVVFKLLIEYQIIEIEQWNATTRFQLVLPSYPTAVVFCIGHHDWGWSGERVGAHLSQTGRRASFHRANQVGSVLPDRRKFGGRIAEAR